MKQAVFGASLSEPHIDHDNDPRAEKLSIYVSIYLSRGAFVAPMFPRIRTRLFNQQHV